jgi:diadenosine tetraphosphate (Ap4A) HIT family hydrolase
MCHEGRPEETQAGLRVLAGAVSDAYLMREDWVRGYTVVIWRGSHAAEIDDLAHEDLAAYWSEVTHVGRALRAHFKPAKLNYQVLGNTLPHVHTHIVPRYLDDAAPGRPLPFLEPRHPAQPEEPYRRDVDALRRLLRPVAGEAESG